MEEEKSLAKKFVKKFAEKGVLVTPEAIEMFLEINDGESFFEEIEKIISEDKITVLTVEIMEKALKEVRNTVSKDYYFPEDRMKEIPAKDWQGKIEVEMDPTDYIDTGEKAKDFLRTFRDRYLKLKKMLQAKRELRRIEPIENITRTLKGEEVCIIGMVYSKRKSIKGNYLLEVEDLTGRCRVIVPGRDPDASYIVLDQVLGFRGVVLDSKTLYSRKIFFPDISKPKPVKTKEPICMVFTSDLHLGSKAFMKNTFEKFLDWLNMKRCAENERKIISRIKYLLIAGDLVDGVGVYPAQERELEEKNIDKQYKMFIEYMKQVPEYIELIMIPGNHDATRLSEPQPSVPNEYIEALKEERNIYSLGNPSFMKIDGYRVLIYHGKSLDNWNMILPRERRGKPEEAMQEMLRSRHLSLLYGQNVPLAPEPKDMLVIEKVPHILHIGHLHVAGEKVYRGIYCFSAGGWQERTAYQVEMNIHPTPGIISIFDMKRHVVLKKNFA